MVDNFREYLKFQTVHPNPNYGPAVDFLIAMGDQIGLESKTLELFTDKLILVMKWEGKDPSAKSILLNGHMDVVPVYPEKWSYDPFEAHMDEKGNIYARGSQDMKCVTIQYLEAIRKLIDEGFVPNQNIYVSVVPDEEIGGTAGMAAFVETEYFRSLNVGFSLDEGIASPTDVFSVFYAERSVMPFTVTCHGKPGHGSLLLADTAGERLISCLSAIQNFRDKELSKLNDDPSMRLGDVTTVNVTVIGGGLQTNVIPHTLTATCDMRITPSFSFAEFCKQVLPQADGENIIVEAHFNSSLDKPTSLDSPYCISFFAACKTLGIETFTSIFPAGTDGRFLRGIGIPVLGFSPINHTPILLHDHDEFLNVDIFLRGIDIYREIIRQISQS